MQQRPSADPLSKPIFIDVQTFRSSWTGALIIVPGLCLIGFFAYALVVQLLFGHPLGSRPMPDGILVFFAALMMTLGAAMVFLGLGGKLITEVWPDAVYVHHFPLTRRHRIGLEEITLAEARTYKPVLDYGGWGVRGLGRRRAFNVAGNRGVQLNIRDGREWLVGSAQAEALAEAINGARAAHAGRVGAP